jgi:hypothetical protein
LQRVGRNRSIAPPLVSVRLQHAKLPSRICPWRILVLHRKSPRSSQSFRRDVAAGLFPQDWAGECETLGEFGEARVAQ